MKDYSKEYQELRQEYPNEDFVEDQNFYSDMNKLLQEKEEIHVSQKITNEILFESRQFLKEEFKKQNDAKASPNKTKPFEIKLIPILGFAATLLLGINIYLFVSTPSSSVSVATKTTTSDSNQQETTPLIADIYFDELMQNDTIDKEFLNIEEEFALIDIEMNLNFTP